MHNWETYNLETLSGLCFDNWTTNYDLFNRYIVYKVNQYWAINTKYYSLGKFIQIDFVKFKAKYSDELDNITLQVIKDYCCLHGFWINLKLNLNKTCCIAILKAVAVN